MNTTSQDGQNGLDMIQWPNDLIEPKPNNFWAWVENLIFWGFNNLLGGIIIFIIILIYATASDISPLLKDERILSHLVSFLILGIVVLSVNSEFGKIEKEFNDRATNYLRRGAAILVFFGFGMAGYISYNIFDDNNDNISLKSAIVYSTGIIVASIIIAYISHIVKISSREQFIKKWLREMDESYRSKFDKGVRNAKQSVKNKNKIDDMNI